MIDECPACKFKSDDPGVLEKHLLEYHFLNYKTFCEIKLLEEKNEDYFCYRCKKYRSPLTYLIPDFYYLPCQECSHLLYKRKSEKLGLIQTLIANIKDYYDRLLGDRYLQLFMVDEIYFNSTIPHTYPVFKSVLGLLNLPSRNDIWFLDWRAGYPRVICPENIEGLKVVNLSSIYNIVSDKDKLIVNDYKIFPEFIAYDVSHHGRYSLLSLSKASNRKVKRFRLPDSDNCIKFNNTDYDFKSIFKIVDQRTGETINPRKLSYQDLTVIKLALLRNKTFVRYIYDIIYESLKVIKTFRDGVFLKNTLTVNPEKILNLNLMWIPDDKFDYSNYINVSIL